MNEYNARRKCRQDAVKFVFTGDDDLDSLPLALQRATAYVLCKNERTDNVCTKYMYSTVLSFVWIFPADVCKRSFFLFILEAISYRVIIWISDWKVLCFRETRSEKLLRNVKEKAIGMGKAERERIRLGRLLRSFRFSHGSWSDRPDTRSGHKKKKRKRARSGFFALASAFIVLPRAAAAAAAAAVLLSGKSGPPRKSRFCEKTRPNVHNYGTSPTIFQMKVLLGTRPAGSFSAYVDLVDCNIFVHSNRRTV